MGKLPQKEIISALESAHDGFMIADSTGRILYFNQAYARLTKLENILKTGMQLQKLQELGMVPSASCLEAVSTGQQVSQIHFTAERKTAIVSVSMPCFDDAGQMLRIITNVRDVSEFLDMREQIEAVQNILSRFSKQMEQPQDACRREVLAASGEMQALLDMAEQVAAVDANVLIQGESGTGKEVVAKFIHGTSPRREKPFLAVNCGAIPENLLESELFGYTQGTFTGQIKGGKKGLIASAEGGTLFLDEIGDMPIALQVKLLRFLDTKTYAPLGASKTVSADVRILSATKRDLNQMVQEGSFREDLYYRLNVVNLVVPALRERRDDIIPLVLFFLERANRTYFQKKHIPPLLLQALYQYDWPGNVRELRNVVERMVVLGQGDTCELPPGFSKKLDTQVRRSYNEGVHPLADYMAQQERSYLIDAYRQCGTTRKTAQALGIDHSTLIRKMKRYGICATKE